MLMNAKILFGSGLFILCFLLSCGGKDPEVNLRMTPAERSRVDTIYKTRIAILRPQWDSLCDARYPAVVAAARDSIVKERLAEEALLRRRGLEE